MIYCDQLSKLQWNQRYKIKGWLCANREKYKNMYKYTSSYTNNNWINITDNYYKFEYDIEILIPAQITAKALTSSHS